MVLNYECNPESTTYSCFSRQYEESCPVWDLRLYIAGDSPRSRAAIANLRRLCEAHLRERYTIEIVDLRITPQLAADDRIFALPTLVRKQPAPVKRITGDLSNLERAVRALEIGSSRFLR